MAEDKHDKTEEPTPKRLADARKKGYVAKSHDLTISILLLGTMFLFFFFGDFMYVRIEKMSIALLSAINYPIFEVGILSYYLNAGLIEILWILTPLLVGVFVMALLFNFIQTGIVFSTYPLQPKWNKLNLFNPRNYERNFGAPAIVRLAFGLLRLSLVIVLSWMIIGNDVTTTLGMSKGNVTEIATYIYKKMLLVGIACAFGYLIVGIFDFFYQKWRYLRELRMSRREVKDELKQLEGDLTVKNKIRAFMRSLSETNFNERIARSDILICDGANYAVALVYNPKVMDAPICICKGTKKTALHLRKLAELQEVPIVEDAYVAQTIFRLAEAGSRIPPEVYHRVAEAFVKKGV